jgi:hypothetical protein
MEWDKSAFELRSDKWYAVVERISGLWRYRIVNVTGSSAICSTTPFKTSDDAIEEAEKWIGKHK